MRALVKERAAPGAAIREVPVPEPGPGEPASVISAQPAGIVAYAGQHAGRGTGLRGSSGTRRGRPGHRDRDGTGAAARRARLALRDRRR